MEDNPEVHMDTDVSSTTADVPETQEVTGSDGQVEMVIVVEKVDEESEMELSSVVTDDLPRVDNEVEAFSVSSPDDKVSSNDVEPHCEAEKSSAVTEDTNPSSPIEDQIQESPKELVNVLKIKDDITTSSTSPNIDVENQNSKDQVDSSDKPKAEDISDHQNEILEKKQEISEKKSPIKQLGMEEIQTTIIEISEKSYDADGKKEEVATVSVDISEKSNDSHIDSISDVSDKDHNKSISRELKSLIKSAKESKIISECTQLTTKTRKSRVGLDNSSASPSFDADKILGRRNSNNSQLSNSSELSEKVPIKRSMRSQNPEFVIKVKQFLNSVTGKNNKGDSDDEGLEENKRDRFETMTPSPKKKKLLDNQEEHLNDEGKLRFDPYCWRCHWHVEQVNEKAHQPMYCTVCPRAYHYKCLSSAEKTKIDSEKSWVCPECLAILHAESSETRSPSMKKISLGLLRELLQYALERIMDLNGVEPFMSPVDRAEFPDYDKYVVHPMDLSLVKKNVEEGVYGSTEAFAADVQWILHNSIIFNTLQSKLTGGARALVRTCRAEMGEIEACAECYAAAHARRPTWFTDVCAAPHVLLWAKLKGFPYWPAKGMSVNSSGLVDVRFFGAHDRAWVPARDCFLYSEKDPNNFRTKRQDILDSMQEAEHHIRNISRRYGKFVYPPFRTQFDPAKLNEHIKAMIPLFDGDLKTDAKEKLSSSSPSALKNKGRSNSKSSKSSNNDGDVSETEDVQTVTSRKMADGAEIAREDDYVVEKDSAMEIDTPKNGDESKKRRRSNLEEAVITIMDNSSSSKKRRHDGVSKDKNEPMSKKSKIDNADKNKDITKTKKAESTPSKENKETPSSTVTNEVSAAVTPKSVKSKSHRSSISKEKVEKEENRKISKSKHAKMDKSGNVDTTPESKARSEKRTHSKNKSINNSHITKVEKKDKLDVTEKNDGKNKGVESDKSNIVKSKTDNREHGKNVAVRSSKKSSHLDDNVFVTKVTNDGLPTISSVRSLSTRVQTPNNVTDTKTLEITIEANPDSSIFTPTSTDNIRNMKEAVNKLQKLKNGTEQSLIGKVGVKAFARMKSPEKSKQNVEVEIKAEPIDFDDADRQVEKLDLMNVFRLRPVNPLPIQSQKLRDVRINKVVVTPVIRNAAPKQPESRKARKTFPQPKKPDEGRSELNGKNSMVYIPIQPPSSQAPVRPIRPITISANTQCVRPPVTSTASTIVNTVRPPMMPIMVTSSAATHPQPNLPPSMPASSVVTKSNLPLVPAVGQMPATVQTVPMITTVNGQCFFSLQPLMSVGGVENPPQPVLSELPERSAVLAPVAASSVPAPPAGQASATPPQVNGTAKDTIGEMPRLQQRPILSHLETSRVAPPSSGPVTDKLNQSAAKLTDFFRSLLEDVLESVDDPASSLVAAKLQLEQVQWKHQQEIQELKHNHDLTVSEMRASLEKEKVRAVSDALRTARADADAAVKAAKAKQWCANCSQEAQFYCCWNTSYCDFPCQRMHWKKHFSVCTQERNQDGGSSGDAGSPHKRLQPAPDSVPALQKSTAAPALTVGGKVAPARTCATTTPEQAAKGNKSSIIVSMVDDKTGTPTVKCVGTYKAGAPQASPLIINNQILNNEESAKKVVTSGGYLIVGSGGSSPLVTPRRTHAIQYYT